MAEKIEKVKCTVEGCEFASTKKGLAIHMSVIHGQRGKYYEYQKVRIAKKKEEKAGKKGAAPLALTTTAKRKVNVGDSAVRNAVWRFCPACGVNLSELNLNMSAFMALTFGS